MSDPGSKYLENAPRPDSGLAESDRHDARMLEILRNQLEEQRLGAARGLADQFEGKGNTQAELCEAEIRRLIDIDTKLAAVNGAIALLSGKA